MDHPAIIVTAYDRPDSLQRLLSSVAAANYTDTDIPLLICIDGPEHEEVYQVASNFNWKYGTKEVIRGESRLGLKDHILHCADRVNELGQIILLEDDLMVSPHFYTYAKETLNYYDTHEKVAGVSLYSYQVAESSFQGFYPLDDGSDVYFMQYPSSWGQCWNKRQWNAFTTWREQHNSMDFLPAYIQQWSDRSWKKEFVAFLMDQDKYFVFPRVSFSTNFADKGENFPFDIQVFQVPLALNYDTFNYSGFTDSKSIYDAWFEPTPKSLGSFTDTIGKYDLAIDLYGAKEMDKLGCDLVLTTRNVSVAERTFSSRMKPLVLNIVLELEGDGINLAKKEHVIEPVRLPDIGESIYFHNKYWHGQVKANYSATIAKFKASNYWKALKSKLK